MSLTQNGTVGTITTTVVKEVTTDPSSGTRFGQSASDVR